MSVRAAIAARASASDAPRAPAKVVVAEERGLTAARRPGAGHVPPKNWISAVTVAAELHAVNRQEDSEVGECPQQQRQRDREQAVLGELGGVTACVPRR
jgi:hypothetical protein